MKAPRRILAFRRLMSTFRCAVIACTALSPVLLLAEVSSTDTTATRSGQAPIEVVSSHWTAIRFQPQLPHSRHSQIPLPGDGVAIDPSQPVSYRIPLPDFVADNHPDEVLLLANFQGDLTLTVETTVASSATCPAEVCNELRLPPAQRPALRVLQAAFRPAVSVDSQIPAAEVALQFTASNKAFLYGAKGTARIDPILLVHTAGRIPHPPRWTIGEQSGIPMPKVTPLFDQFLRDTSITLAPDGNYYMTGTTGGPEVMVVTSDLSVWRSPDLRHWFPVIASPRPSTVVWNIDRDGTWQKPIFMRDGEPFRPLWAPEIHYINGTFWIPFSVPRKGITILKSASGKAEGPYQVAIHPDEPLSNGIDASLFQDDDGTVYALYGGGWIAKMKPDLSGLAEPFRHLASAVSGREIGFEGVSLFKFKGRYYLNAADFVLGDYNTYTASSASIYGPYSERYLSVPHAGHNNFFPDKQGRMWTTFFGNDLHTPVHAQPAVFPMYQDDRGRWRPVASFKWPAEKSVQTVQTAGSIGPSSGEPQQVGIMPSNR